MREAAREELDRIDKLDPGQGQLDAYLFGTGDLNAGLVGGGLDYSHRLSNSWSALVRGTAGYRYGDEYGMQFDALAAIRGRL